MKRFPLYCPKGKHLFYRPADVAACVCKHPHLRCAKLKAETGDLLSAYIGGSYDVVRISRTRSTDNLFGDS